MNGENIIAWNVTNWVTILIMAAAGFFVVGLAQKWWQQNNTQAGTSSQ